MHPPLFYFLQFEPTTYPVLRKTPIPKIGKQEIQSKRLDWISQVTGHQVSPSLRAVLHSNSRPRNHPIPFWAREEAEEGDEMHLSTSPLPPPLLPFLSPPRFIYLLLDKVLLYLFLSWVLDLAFGKGVSVFLFPSKSAWGWVDPFWAWVVVIGLGSTWHTNKCIVISLTYHHILSHPSNPPFALEPALPLLFVCLFACICARLCACSLMIGVEGVWGVEWVSEQDWGQDLRLISTHIVGTCVIFLGVLLF